MKYINYSIPEILEKKEKGVKTSELLSLYEAVENYKESLESRVEECIRMLKVSKPDNEMRWVQENAPADIRQYVCCAILGKEVNVLKRSERKWKTVSDLGLEVEGKGDSQVKKEEWLLEWEKRAKGFANEKQKVYETHAHYNLKEYNGCREKLMDLMHQSGIDTIVLPAADYASNAQMLELFDKPAYEYIKYAFGSHPKYLWKENWTEETWKGFRTLLEHPKCVAIGETGLDYSYTEFCEDHRNMQLEMFQKFVDISIEHKLPLVLHIRPADEGKYCVYDVDEDALSILRKSDIKSGAVLHCFGGNIDDVSRYMEAGVTTFGIGGRVTYGNMQLEEAVAKMPESAIILETDAPYIKIGEDRMPNTSLALYHIANKIAELRGCTVDHILAVTYENAKNLYR